MTEPAMLFPSPMGGEELEENRRERGVDRLLSALGGRMAGLLPVCALVSTFWKVG
jgi:hypothetical protein